MAFASAAVTVAATATALNPSDADSQSLLVSNVGAATVYLGPSDVTTSTGVPLAAGASVSVNSLSGGEVLYGIVASGTNEVRVLRQGVG